MGRTSPHGLWGQAALDSINGGYVTESCHDADSSRSTYMWILTTQRIHFNHFKKSTDEILQNLKEAVNISRPKIKRNLTISSMLAEPKRAGLDLCRDILCMGNSMIRAL